jgi:hypothetical protein
VLNINSSVAACLAIFVTIKEKNKSNLKANIFLVVGLVLWFNSSNQRGVFRSIKNTFNIKKKTVVTSIILIVILIVSIASYTLTQIDYDDVLVSSEPNANYVISKQNKINEVPIGLISSLTGAWSSGGKSIKIAVEKAERDVNNYFENKNSSIRTRLLIEDSKTDPVPITLMNTKSFITS